MRLKLALRRPLKYFMIQNSKNSETITARQKSWLKIIELTTGTTGFFILWLLAYPVLNLGTPDSIPVVAYKHNDIVVQLPLPILTHIFGISEDLNVYGKNSEKVDFSIHQSKKIIGNYVLGSTHGSLDGQEIVKYHFVPVNKEAH